MASKKGAARQVAAKAKANRGVPDLSFLRRIVTDAQLFDWLMSDDDDPAVVMPGPINPDLRGKVADSPSPAIDPSSVFPIKRTVERTESTMLSDVRDKLAEILELAIDGGQSCADWPQGHGHCFGCTIGEIAQTALADLDEIVRP